MKNRKFLSILGLTSLLLVILVVIEIFFYSFLEPTKSVKSASIAVSKLNFSQPVNQADNDSTTLSAKVSPKPINLIPPSYGKSVRVPILTYHYIGANPNPGKDPARDNLSVTPELFEQQLDYLSKNGYTSISLDTLHAALKGGLLPPKPVVLTFDDGYIDFYINAFPILKRFNMRATSFIPSGLIGSGYYMSWDQIKEIQSSGLVSFEAHSIHHSDLTLLSIDAVKTEIQESKKILESMIGSPANFFAYPYGTSNEIIWQLVKEAGYLGAVGTWYGTIENEGNIFDMPRVKIPGGISIENFASKL